MKTTVRIAIRFFFGVAVCFYVMLFIPVGLLSILLLAQGETLQGKLFGLTVLLVAPIPVLLWISGFMKNRRRYWSAAGLLAALAAITLGVCYRLTPTASASSHSPVRSCFTGATHYSRASIANLVPEIDQLKLGTYVFPYVDPFIDSSQAVRIRGLFLSVYHEMDESDEFARLGSVLNYAYQDIFLGKRPQGHFYEYLPQSQQQARLPVVVFLHGSLGNFKGYLWLWKSFADKHHFALVAPTFGAGNWNRNGGIECIEKMRQYCLSHPRMNGREIYLIGLSNGGKGVSRAAKAYPGAYKGLIFISPIMEKDILLSDKFTAGWRGKNVLVLQGSNDRRIPIRYIKERVCWLQQKGVKVKAVYYPDEDHFLMFSAWNKLAKDIAEWMELNGHNETATRK